MCNYDDEEAARAVLWKNQLSELRFELRSQLEKAESDDVDREAAARTLELYADAVRDGYLESAPLRGRWWRETHQAADGKEATGR